MVQARNNVATEGAIGRIFANGSQVNAGNAMILQEQYAAGTAINTTVVETSLYTIAGFVPSMSGGVYTTPSTLVTIPQNFLSIGMLYRGMIVGTIANTGTPTLRVRVVLRNTAGTIAYTLSDSTAVAMTTISASDFQVDYDFMVAASGVTGSLVGRIRYRYASTTVTTVPAAVTVDTTQQYTVDTLLTWGTSSASNTATVLWSFLELE